MIPEVVRMMSHCRLCVSRLTIPAPCILREQVKVEQLRTLRKRKASVPIPPSKATPYCTQKALLGLKSRLSARPLDHCSDVAIFKCSVGTFRCFPNHNVHHG